MRILTVEMPEELVELLGSEQGASITLREAAVLELFREHKISTGKAAELLGMSYRDFLTLLQERSIPLLTTPPRDTRTVAGLLKDTNPQQ